MLFTYKEATMNKYFLKYKFVYLFAILFIISMPQNTIAHAHDIINQFGKFIQEMVNNVDTFLSKKDKNSYWQHMQIINQTMNRHPLPIRSAFQSESELEKEATSIAQDFRKPFIETQGVLQKYRGKNKGFAGNLVKELRAALPLGQLFLKLKTKLMHLKEKAIRQNDIELVKTIKRFITYIDQKIIVWSKKRPLELFSALCRRMELR